MKRIDFIKLKPTKLRCSYDDNYATYLAYYPNGGNDKVCDRHQKQMAEYNERLQLKLPLITQ